MKKRIALLALGLMLACIPAAALAEETDQQTAGDGGLSLLIELPADRADELYRLNDEFVTSRISFQKDDTVTFLPDASAQALLLDWYDAPASYAVSQRSADGGTLREETIADGQLRRLVSLDAACTKIVLTFESAGSLGGVSAYAADEPLPDGVIALQPAPERADLLIVSAEPGMEFLQFGAVLPTYAREKGVASAVLYVSDYGKRARAYEALAGLTDAGYATYPIFGGFTCDNYDSYKIAAAGFVKQTLTEYLEGQFNALQPKVIVTHATADVSGAHSLTAECVLAAAQNCTSVEKVYVYGETEGTTPTVIDMNAPLNAYDGKTAAEVASSAYALHASRRVFHQQIDASGAFTLAYTTVGEDEANDDLLEHIAAASLISYAPATPSPSPSPEPTATPAPTAAPEAAPQEPQQEAPSGFGLSGLLVLIPLSIGAALTAALFVFAFRPLRTRRGKGDAVCLCLIPLALGLAAGAMLSGAKAQRTGGAEQSAVSAAAPSATPDATASPEQSATPEPTAEPTPDPVETFEASYYRTADDPAEVIVVDEEHGHWAYRSDDLGIDIERVSTVNGDGNPLTYFVADIHMKDISQFRPGFGAEGHTGRGAIYPWIMARREKAVLWITGDNLINSEREEKGILIRDGRMFWSGEKEDTLALYPDMSMRIVKKYTTTPGALLEDGVENAYSFGPTLIENGVINEDAKYHRVRRANPRAGIGYLEPGHYIAIVVDGRQKDYSVGMPVWEFADLFAQYGCTQAYNLDGGLSAAMIFMGEQINSHSGNRLGASDDISYQRAVPDGLMFGYSEQVPGVDDPVGNDGNKQ
ncbi:MAG: phosphodiester glycosidase family protein [Clostridiales bacterium]|nr:phosphodiester glycosidase family protein [Clostridiales bacterium]